MEDMQILEMRAPDNITGKRRDENGDNPFDDDDRMPEGANDDDDDMTRRQRGGC